MTVMNMIYLHPSERNMKMKMMRTKFIVFLLLLLSVPSAAQQKNKPTDDTFQRNPDFYFELLNYSASDSAKTRVDLFINMPFDKVKFIKYGETFKAEYGITASFYAEDKKTLLAERVWTEKIETMNFEQTISSKNANVSLKSFVVPPQNVFVKIVVEDRDTRKEYAAEQLFVVRKFDAPIAVSDILIVNSSKTENVGRTIVPNISKTILNDLEALPVFYEIYLKKPEKLFIRYNIIGPDEKAVYSRIFEVELPAGRSQMYYEFDSLAFTAGDYNAVVTVNDDEYNLAASVNKSFVSLLVGLPFVIKNLDKAIDQMIYIATATEIDEIKEGQNYQERLESFLNWWKKKDPTDNTQENEVFNEYFRRVEYANRNFTHYTEGWRTDMGMVYIILGAPSNIDRHPFDYDRKPYEIWEYYELNRRFVFVDNTGFGDYRLTTPLYGDTYRYRQ